MQNQTQIQTQIQTNATTVQTHDGDDWWMSDDDDDMYDLIDFGIASNGGRLSMQRG
jgi:hypothetical protein